MQARARDPEEKLDMRTKLFISSVFWTDRSAVDKEERRCGGPGKGKAKKNASKRENVKRNLV